MKKNHCDRSLKLCSHILSITVIYPHNFEFWMARIYFGWLGFILNRPMFRKLKSLGLSRQEERRTGFPLSEELVEREITICQGTIQNAKFALEFGVSMNIAGGTHHAYRDRGEGFCLLNDIAIASHWLSKYCLLLKEQAR